MSGQTILLFPKQLKKETIDDLIDLWGVSWNPCNELKPVGCKSRDSYKELGIYNYHSI